MKIDNMVTQKSSLALIGDQFWSGYIVIVGREWMYQMWQDITLRLSNFVHSLRVCSIFFSTNWQVC